MTLREGIALLRRSQQRDGSFLSYSSANPDDFSNARIYHTTFTTALILSCLNTLVPTPEMGKIRKKAARYLLTQKSKRWSWNYSRAMSYPDDLDDTFCALAALHGYNKKLIDGKVLAHVVKILTAVEVKPGGPYRTWLVPKTAEKVWQDVDLAVNANVAYFLSLLNVSVPGVMALIERAIDKEKFESPYYPSAFPIVYFISRWYRGSKIKKLTRYVKRLRPRNPLEQTLQNSALLNLGVLPRKPKIEKRPNAFCIDPAIGGKTYYAGSPALTTAFCVEALAKYEQATSKKKASPDDAMYNEVVGLVRKKIDRLGEPISKPFYVTMEKLLSKRKNIVLLPSMFADACDVSVSKKLLVQLGAATLYGWIAYTVYDDFLDNEGDPKCLGAANAALRECVALFQQTIPDKQFQTMFTQVMDGIDHANSWEVANCRSLKKLPNFGNLQIIANKSLGHALGPVAIACHMRDYRRAKLLLKFFSHYIIARQLNDDMHDWENDLNASRVTPVVAMLLKRKSDDLKRRFWRRTVVDVCRLVMRHSGAARQTLRELKLKRTQAFETIVDEVERIAVKTLQERERTLQFLKTLRRKTQQEK